MWLRIGTGDGSCKHGYEPFGFIKDGKYLVQLMVSWLLKGDSVPCS
jgi:hypothetical protein